MNCLCAICGDRNQREFLAQMTSFDVWFDVIYHFFPISSQYLMTWGVDSPVCPSLFFAYFLFEGPPVGRSGSGISFILPCEQRPFDLPQGAFIWNYAMILGFREKRWREICDPPLEGGKERKHETHYWRPKTFFSIKNVALFGLRP